MDEAELDTWWEKLPEKRKHQIHSWLAKEEAPVDLPGQISLLDMKGEEQ